MQAHNLRVRVEDDSGAGYEQDFAIGVSNVVDLDGDGIEDHLDDDIDGDNLANSLEWINGSDPNDANSTNHAPTEVNTTTPLNLPENTPSGSAFGQVIAVDPDSDANISYSLGAVFPPDLSPGVWLDADDSSTLWQDTTALTEANQTGHGIALWQDRTPHERNATMATFATQPVLRENFLNGRSVLRFDGTNYLDVDFSWLANTDYTVIAVEGRRSNKSSNYFLLNSGGNSSNRNGHFGYRQNGTYTLAQYGNDLDSGIAGYSQQVFRAWTHWFDDDVGHMIYLNGDSFASNSNKAGFTQVNQGR